MNTVYRSEQINVESYTCIQIYYKDAINNCKEMIFSTYYSQLPKKAKDDKIVSDASSLIDTNLYFFFVLGSH